VTSTITISGCSHTAASSASSVYVNIVHTYRGDLSIYLYAPDVPEGLNREALLKALSDGDQNGDGRIEVIELGQYVERMVPELTEKKWGMAQRPRFTINANFPIAATMAPDSNADAVIPRAATHVIIAPVTVASADRGAPADKDKLQPGTTVRVLKADGDRALIARDGRQLGFVPVKALAPLN